MTKEESIIWMNGVELLVEFLYSPYKPDYFGGLLENGEQGEDSQVELISVRAGDTNILPMLQEMYEWKIKFGNSVYVNIEKTICEKAEAALLKSKATSDWPSLV